MIELKSVEKNRKKSVSAPKRHVKMNLASVFFLILLMLQLLCMFHYGNAKQGYFEDELWSYGLANSYYHPHVDSDNALSKGWVTGKYFKDYLEVLPNQRFRYGSVFYNQAHDNHPPLFYIVLHTVSSFFPDTFSKWYGIGPNMVYFAISMLLLFSLAKRLFKSEWIALIPVIAYGFSAGAISNVVFIRMYVLLTVWVLALLNLHVKWIMEDQILKKDYLVLVIVAHLGFMTHNYFFLVAFFTCAFYFFHLLFKKQFASLVKYCMAMFASLAFTVITFPFTVYQLFLGYRGSEAVHNFFSVTDFIDHVKAFWRIIGEGLFANEINLFALVLLTGGLGTLMVYMIRRKRETKTPALNTQNMQAAEASRTWISVGCIFFMVTLYFFMIAKIAPYLVDRYMFGIYPVIVLLAFFGLYEIFRYWSSERITFGILLIVSCTFALSGIRGKNVQYLYTDRKDNVKIMEENEGGTCLYITDAMYMLVHNALELEHMGIVFVATPDQIESLSNQINTSKDSIIVYVNDGLNQEDILNRVCTTLGFSNWKHLFNSGYEVYELTR